MQISPPKIYRKLPTNLKVKVNDLFEAAFKELFIVRNPSYKDREYGKEYFDFKSTTKLSSVWVYYSEQNIIVRLPDKQVFFELRTARNKNLISKKEQDQYHQSKVGIAGLSVGASIARMLTLTGGPAIIKVADFDQIDFSNINRLQAGIFDIGKKKTQVLARFLWELDPFAELSLYSDGLNKKNIESFIKTNPRLDIFIDEMDSIPLKVLAREICKKQKIPVLMATDVGEGVILDVERYDIEKNYNPFHGSLAAKDLQSIKNNDFKNWLKIANKIVSRRYLSGRMSRSLTKIGKSLAGVPQLGSSATLAGIVAAYAVRMIATHKPLPSGRYSFALDKMKKTK